MQNMQNLYFPVTDPPLPLKVRAFASYIYPSYNSELTSSEKKAKYDHMKTTAVTQNLYFPIYTKGKQEDWPACHCNLSVFASWILPAILNVFIILACCKGSWSHPTIWTGSNSFSLMATTRNYLHIWEKRHPQKIRYTQGAGREKRNEKGKGTQKTKTKRIREKQKRRKKKTERKLRKITSKRRRKRRKKGVAVKRKKNREEKQNRKEKRKEKKCCLNKMDTSAQKKRTLTVEPAAAIKEYMKSTPVTTSVGSRCFTSPGLPEINDHRQYESYPTPCITWYDSPQDWYTWGAFSPPH